MNDEREKSEPAPLGGWGSEWTAPRALRGAVVDAARRRGLIRGGFMSGRAFRWSAAAVAAALMFVAGYGIGTRQGANAMSGQTEARPAATAAPEVTRYALFLFEDESYQAAPAAEAMDRVREYGAWARGLAESGRFVDGEKLADDGRFCRIENGTLAATGPQSDERRGALTGYFVIGAASLEEAMEVARGCPHLKYGGTLEIRQLES